MNGKKRLFIASLCITLFCLCGGGSDVGNPDIKGRIVDVSGTPIVNCMVVLGPRGGDPGSVDTIDLETVVIYVHAMPFDTVRTGSDGSYTFAAVPPGEYSVFASKENALGICKIDHELYVDSDADITIDISAKLCVDNYHQSMDTLPNSFLAARISGTTITNDVAVTGKLFFSAVPAGDVDVILYRKNKSRDYIKDLQFYASCSVTVMVDPLRNQKYWTFMKDSYREPMGRPYVLGSTPGSGAEGQIALVNKDKSYDVEIQFSHGMNTIKTSAALHAFSDDNRVMIDSLWWQGADVVRIDLCSSDDSTMCVNDSLYLKKGVQYSVIIDTLAQTNLGVGFAWPDTLSFVPVP